MLFLFTLASVDNNKALLLVWDYLLCFHGLTVCLIFSSTVCVATLVAEMSSQAKRILILCEISNVK